MNGLIKSGDLQGLHLVGHDGAKLGLVREIYVDPVAGRIEFIVVEAASLLGGSGKFHPMPLSALHYDRRAGAYQTTLTKDEFKASPSYDREQLANASYGWDEQATRFFSALRPHPQR